MKGYYNDLYALFRHEHQAEQYFNRLPTQVQDSICSRYRSVDTFDRLQSFAEKEMNQMR